MENLIVETKYTEVVKNKPESPIEFFYEINALVKIPQTQNIKVNLKAIPKAYTVDVKHEDFSFVIPQNEARKYAVGDEIKFTMHFVTKQTSFKF